MNIKQHTLKLKDGKKGAHFLAILIDALKQNKKVKVTNLGIFEVRKMKGKAMYDYQTKQMVERPSYNKITFAPTKKFKRAFN